jgi:transposase
VIRIQLTEADARELEAAFRGTEDRHHRDRLQIVLLAHRGRKRQDIATDLGVHRKTVTRWISAYCERGLSGLTPRTAPGQEPTIPAALADEVRRWVIEGPAAQGVDRANWTYDGLADHLKATHGVHTSRSAVHRFCGKIGIRPYRPTYRYLRGDPEKQARAREELAGLKKRRRRVNSCC